MLLLSGQADLGGTAKKQLLLWTANSVKPLSKAMARPKLEGFLELENNLNLRVFGS